MKESSIHHADIAIIGSGFGGSLLALVLARRGQSVVLIDRAAHPRFAIGESSTPIADMILADLAARYDLPRLSPLAQYGSWCRTYPELKRGRKRGFSYFRHELGRPFQPATDHTNELLVAASGDNERCDTHWYRADVDRFFAREAERAGVMLLEQTAIECCELSEEWKLSLQPRQKPMMTIQTGFLVDATGSGDFGRQWLATEDVSETLLTHSQAIYSHFDHVVPWRDILESSGSLLYDHPFACDDAALHHLFDEGWMWQLRFDHGVVSAGFSFNRKVAPQLSANPAESWSIWLQKYPSIAAQFERAKRVDPPGKIFVSGRLQRKASRAVGRRWAALPHAFGFVDALHSTGIAWNLSGVERLAEILCESPDDTIRMKRLANYERQLQRELAMIDNLVDLCYETLPRFRLFVLAVMAYFTATVTYESRRIQSQTTSFMCADDEPLCACLDQVSRLLREMLHHPESEFDRAEVRIRRLIEPYNTAGLCRPEAMNMYQHTAAR